MNVISLLKSYSFEVTKLFFLKFKFKKKFSLGHYSVVYTFFNIDVLDMKAIPTRDKSLLEDTFEVTLGPVAFFQENFRWLS